MNKEKRFSFCLCVVVEPLIRQTTSSAPSLLVVLSCFCAHTHIFFPPSPTNNTPQWLDTSWHGQPEVNARHQNPTRKSTRKQVKAGIHLQANAVQPLGRDRPTTWAVSATRFCPSSSHSELKPNQIKQAPTQARHCDNTTHHTAAVLLCPHSITVA